MKSKNTTDSRVPLEGEDFRGKIYQRDQVLVSRSLPKGKELWPRNRYEAVVIKIVDGDTLDLAVDLGFMVSIEERFRLDGINAPEVKGEERPRGLAAKEYLEGLIPVGSTVWVESIKRGSFRRWIGRLFLERDDALCLSDIMVREGHAEYKEY